MKTFWSISCSTVMRAPLRIQFNKDIYPFFMAVYSAELQSFWAHSSKSFKSIFQVTTLSKLFSMKIIAANLRSQILFIFDNNMMSNRIKEFFVKKISIQSLKFIDLQLRFAYFFKTRLNLRLSPKML